MGYDRNVGVMGESVGWNFPNANGGQTNGFNDSSIDTFIGNRTHSFVRETIQNSLDAKIDGLAAGVSFSIARVKSSDIHQLTSIKEYLSYACQQSDSDQGELSEASKFYRNAIDLLEDEPWISILCVHDYNTTGLTGPTSEEDPKPSNWKALVKGSGVSVKSRKDALGSFGHGSKAPFAISQMRTVFYLSKIAPHDGNKWRFQGKSILQSMKTPLISKTQGVGYYGKTKNCEPLLDGEVPNWARELRESVSNDTGTSIFIPFPDLSLDVEQVWKYVELSVLSNFYYAILKGNLEVRLQDEPILMQKNVKDRFEKTVMKAINEGGKVQKEFKESLQTAITIHSAPLDTSGIVHLEGVGESEYFMRVGSEVEGRTVGIARQNGMLLTRRAPRLIRHSGTKPFDLFVCVVTREGSEFLRRLENPAHDSFEFDRIISIEERKEFEQRYETFTKAIKKLIENHAGILGNDEEFTDDLDDFLGVAGDVAKQDEGKESSDAIEIERRVTKRISQPELGNLPGENVGSAGLGDDEVETPEPRPLVRPGTIPSRISKTKFHPVKDPRIVSKGGGWVHVFFTPTTKAPFRLQIHRSGVDLSEPIAFKINRAAKEMTEITFPARRRIRREKVELFLSQKEFQYAIEIRNLTTEEMAK